MFFWNFAFWISLFIVLAVGEYKVYTSKSIGYKNYFLLERLPVKAPYICSFNTSFKNSDSMIEEIYTNMTSKILNPMLPKAETEVRFKAVVKNGAIAYPAVMCVA